MPTSTSASRTFNLSLTEDEGTPEDYPGVKITKQEDGTMMFTQPQLIDSILQDLGLVKEDRTPEPNTKMMDIPALSSKLIGLDLNGDPFDCEWGYHSMIGKLNFSEKKNKSFWLKLPRLTATKTRPRRD